MTEQMQRDRPRQRRRGEELEAALLEGLVRYQVAGELFT
jgi:hypothetical protein